MTDQEWQEAADAFKLRAQAIRRRHFPELKMCKNPFIFKNVTSYWGLAKKYADGWQTKYTWALLLLPEWIQDGVIYEELIHCVDKTRGYRYIHTQWFKQKFRELYPLVNYMDMALKEFGAIKWEVDKGWLEAWGEEPEVKRPVKAKPKPKPTETMKTLDALIAGLQEGLLPSEIWEVA